MPKSHPEALAENAILRAELYKARERARVMALIAHMATHDMQEPPTPHAEGSCPPARTTPKDG